MAKVLACEGRMKALIENPETKVSHAGGGLETLKGLHTYDMYDNPKYQDMFGLLTDKAQAEQSTARRSSQAGIPVLASGTGEEGPSEEAVAEEEAEEEVATGATEEEEEEEDVTPAATEGEGADEKEAAAEEEEAPAVAAP